MFTKKQILVRVRLSEVAVKPITVYKLSAWLCFALVSLAVCLWGWGC